MNEENKNINQSTSENAKEKPVKKEKTKNKKSGKKGGLTALLKSRRAKHGSIAAAITAIVIALAIILNVVVGLLVDRFPNLVLDLTSNSSFALQEDTIDYMAHLDKDVKVTVLAAKDVFEKNGSYFVQADKLLDKMEAASNGKMKLEYIDLASNPTFASSYENVNWDSEANNVAIVECGEQYTALALDDCFEYDESSYSYTGTTIEQAVVTAILNVTTEDKVVVDMIKGNQEQDYSAITQLLENNAYQVNEVSLATNGLDSDATLAIMYAPSVDLDKSSVTKLEQWLDNDGKNGRMFIYVPTGEKPNMPNFDEFLEKWGMKVNSGFVYETSLEKVVSGDSLFIFTADYTDYYQDGLKNAKIPVVVSDSHDIDILDENTAHALLTTSDKGGILPVDAASDFSYEEGLKGEAVNVAAEGVVSNSDEQSSRVIVFGSFMMFNSSIMQYNSFNNSAYLMNIINTVSGKDDVGITIESKSIKVEELGVTDVATQNTMLILFVVIVPLAILVTGFVVWLRRRNK